MGRNIRTRLPVLKSKLYPRWPDLVKVAERDAEFKLKEARNYNDRHGARDLKCIPAGNAVLMQSPVTKKWEALPTEVEGKVGERSYLVRNRRQIRPLLEVTPRISRGGGHREGTAETLQAAPGEPQKGDTNAGVGGSPAKIGSSESAPRLSSNIATESSPVLRTRSGRVVRKVERLDL